MRHVLFLFGTRPEAIKLAPVIKELQAHSSEFQAKICVTAQHREMLDQILDFFDIKPNYDLNIMEEDQSLFDITVNATRGIEGVLKEVKPDLVMVQGDTTTTFISSLASFYLKIPVAHIEAGLRTNDKYSPFPEEINRRLTSHIADFHFAPTERAQDNLIREGIYKDKIFVTGNTVIDALLMTIEKVKNKKARDFESLKSIDFKEHKLILVTAHRRESFGKPLEEICLALNDIADHNKNVIIIYPVHPNPNVRRPVRQILGKKENIFLINPVSYDCLVWLINKSYLILTDSGGIQEEAPSLGKPVLVMREVTERTEGISAGTAKLVGTDRKTIINETQKLLDDKFICDKMNKAHNPYGDGKAAKRIMDIILKYF
jgi:UDP-N-acetylglucosamine 2-epimerase (non-hydrolysing)